MGVGDSSAVCIVLVGLDALRTLVRARRRPWRKGESFGGRAEEEGVGEERLLRCGGVVFVLAWCFEGEVVEVEARELRVGVANPVVVDVLGGVDSVADALELMTVYRGGRSVTAPLSIVWSELSCDDCCCRLSKWL